MSSPFHNILRFTHTFSSVEMVCMQESIMLRQAQSLPQWSGQTTSWYRLLGRSCRCHPSTNRGRSVSAATLRPWETLATEWEATRQYSGLQPVQFGKSNYSCPNCEVLSQIVHPGPGWHCCTPGI